MQRAADAEGASAREQETSAEGYARDEVDEGVDEARRFGVACGRGLRHDNDFGGMPLTRRGKLFTTEASRRPCVDAPEFGSRRLPKVALEGAGSLECQRSRSRSPLYRTRSIPPFLSVRASLNRDLGLAGTAPVPYRLYPRLLSRARHWGSSRDRTAAVVVASAARSPKPRRRFDNAVSTPK